MLLVKKINVSRTIHVSEITEILTRAGCSHRKMYEKATMYSESISRFYRNDRKFPSIHRAVASKRQTEALGSVML